MSLFKSNDGTYRCRNAEPGTFGHECGKPATWVGVKESGYEASYCGSCKETGTEAKQSVDWRPL